jgi:hypothetical protein
LEFRARIPKKSLKTIIMLRVFHQEFRNRILSGEPNNLQGVVDVDLEIRLGDGGVRLQSGSEAAAYSGPMGLAIFSLF